MGGKELSAVFIVDITGSLCHHTQWATLVSGRSVSLTHLLPYLPQENGRHLCSLELDSNELSLLRQRYLDEPLTRVLHVSCLRQLVLLLHTRRQRSRRVQLRPYPTLSPPSPTIRIKKFELLFRKVTVAEPSFLLATFSHLLSLKLCRNTNTSSGFAVANTRSPDIAAGPFFTSPEYGVF